MKRLALLALALPLADGFAQQPASPASPTPLAARPQSAPYDHLTHAPSATALRTRSTIRIDGVLDEREWADAIPINRFTQYDPQEGQPVSEATDVRFLFDEEALYIGARMSDR